MNESDDLSQPFLDQHASTTRVNSVQEAEEWTRTWEADNGMARPPLIDKRDEPEIETRPLPEPKPLRTETDDPLGRPEGKGKSTAAKVAKNITEIPGQIVAGVDDAGRNALGWLDPLTNWLNENVADLRYEKFEQPKTGTGMLTRKISEFLTGFIPSLKLLKGVGLVSQPSASVLAGAIADFAVRDPHEGRLSDLWNEMELPANGLTDFLASKEDDTEVEARFKNMLEGAVTGAAFEGIVLAARALRAARAQPGVKEAEEAYLKAKYGEVPETEYKKIVGDPSKPHIEMKVVKPHPAAGKVKDAMERADEIDPRAVIRKRSVYGVSVPDDWEVYVNFARMDTSKQVDFTIGKMAELFKGHIDEATRGKITHDVTKEMADKLNMTVPELLARRKGQPFNAEQALAARHLWVASGEQLLALAKKASGPNAGPLDMFAFRRQMAVHAAIQSEVIGARTETARALNAWKIEAKGGIERARAIQQVLTAMGGPDQAAEMARRLTILAEIGDPKALEAFARAGWGARTVDVIKEVWINGLLSSPKTHMVNITSNTLVAFQQIYERGAASAVRQFVGGEGVAPGEAAAMAWAGIESVKDAFRLAAKALKTGESGHVFNKIDLPRDRGLSAEAARIGSDTTLGRAVGFISSGVNIPGRLLIAEDEFFKTIGYRMELRAQALRTAFHEGHRGKELASRVQDILNNPPENIVINSADAALYNTFTSQMGWFGRTVIGAREGGSVLNPAWLVLPFVRTPVNIARYAFERTPFAPLVGQWRADIAAGGARADLALARMSTGTAIMLAAMDMADRGLITGDGPRGEDKEVREALQRQGWQPYSIKIGDRWFSYNRADPFGMTVGFAASITEAIKKGEIDEDDVDEWWEVTAMAIAAVSQVTISKTYLEGFANTVEVMGDPKRYSKEYIQDLVSSFTPGASASLAVKNFMDPVQREAGTPWEAVQARIAGLSERLPPRRNLWGEVITSESGLGKLYDLASPVQSKAQVESPIDREIVKLNAGPNRISKRAPFNGVDVNFRFYPKAYDDYVRLAGNDMKHPAWGMGAKDFLNSVVSGQHALSAAWNVMSDQTRKEFIQGTISDYRKLAQQEILRDPKHRGFAEEVQRLQQNYRAAKMPVME